jgi:hypothetical protein
LDGFTDCTDDICQIGSITHQCRSTATCHHTRRRTADIEFDSCNLFSIFSIQIYCCRYQCFASPPIDLDY